MLIHLNAHSYHSLLEGLPAPADLVHTAVELGLPALALTDHMSAGGAVEFSRACGQAGLRPILGAEIDLDWGAETGRVVLLLEDDRGWANLCRLLSTANLRGDAEARVRWEELSAWNSGLLALADLQGDPRGRRLQQLGELFAGRLYAALHALPNQDQTAEIAQRCKIPAAAVHPIYFLKPVQVDLQRVVEAIRRVTPLNQLPPVHPLIARGYFVPPDEAALRFNRWPAAVACTQEIAERCLGSLPLGRPHFPRVQIPAGQTAQEYLRRAAEEGARQLYGQINAHIQARLDHELEVIARKGYEPIFLIVQEIIQYARSEGIPTASRGSASSSLVAHCLGITTPDPLALDLYFERFLNEARSSPPDIDTDICSQGRDRVIRHVFETYGSERTAMVGTINRFAPRSAFSDTAKAYGLPPEKIREIADGLPGAFFGRRFGRGEEDPYAEHQTRYPQYREIFQSARALFEVPRHLSVHAGGLVVAPGRLDELAPVTHSGAKGISITQMDLDSVEALGLVKIDLLGIRGLTVLGDVARAIHSWQRMEYPRPLAVLDAIPAEDLQTADTVEHGRTIGCFQIESPGMRAVLREIRARSPRDIMAALALYRPGPLQGGLRDAFVRRFRGDETVEHIHPAMSSLLAETYGVILYQEQVLRIAHQLAGMTLSEADLLRRAMSHFDPGREMQNLKKRFIDGAEQVSGIPPETGARVWEMMAAFAGYGFPKAHAASYAVAAWRSAWCKTYFPAEFLAAVLANWGGYYSQRVYLMEARRLGLAVRAPHINHSRRQFSAAYPQGEPVLYMGLDQVRDLTRRTQERILRLRPFTSADDFLSRVDPRRQEAEALVQVGALEGLGTIPDLLERVLNGGGWQPGQMSLFGWGQSGRADWSLEERAAAQERLLGISLDAHPLDLAARQIAAAGAISTAEAAARMGQRVTVAGVRQSGHRSRTARGEAMMFMTLEDLDGMLDAVLFPDIYRRVRGFIHSARPLLLSGMMEMDESRGEPLLRVERAALLA